MLFESLLVKQVDAKFSVNVSLGDGGPGGVNVPLDADHLGVTLRDVLDINEVDVLGDLLFERQAGLRGVGGTHDGGVDFKLGDAEQPLQAAGYWAGDSLAQGGRRADLGDALLRRRGLGGCQHGVGGGLFAGGKQSY